jgi:hypothetical protein
MALVSSKSESHRIWQLELEAYAFTTYNKPGKINSTCAC